MCTVEYASVYCVSSAVTDQLCVRYLGYAVCEGPEEMVRGKMCKSERGWRCTDCPFYGSVNRETVAPLVISRQFRLYNNEELTFVKRSQGFTQFYGSEFI